MKADQYVQILEQGLPESMENSGIPAGNIIIQQDNDPKHTSNLATDFFNAHGIQVLDWPAQSPDLNPFEHQIMLEVSIMLSYWERVLMVSENN